MSQFGMHSATHGQDAPALPPTGQVPSRPKVASSATHGQDAPALPPRVGGWEHKIVVSGFDPKGCT